VKHRVLGSITAIANQKGGVGKTTTSINLAASLAALDKRVLLIDLDPQGNTTTGLGVDKKMIRHGAYDVVAGDCPLSDAISETEFHGLFILPSTIDLVGAEVELVNERAREQRLQSAFSSYEGEKFDYVFLDCPPALGILTINALTAADHVMITLQAEFYAMEGLTQLMTTISRIRHSLNPQLTMSGILMTMVDRRNNLSTQVEQDVRDYFGSQVFENVIPRNVRLSEAPSFGLPVMYHDIRSTGAQAYLAVAQEVMSRSILES
jgi:chromosome partitioning protein